MADVYRVKICFKDSLKDLIIRIESAMKPYIENRIFIPEKRVFVEVASQQKG